MKECLIIGGGIESLITALMIKKNGANIDITIKTINSDPREVDFTNAFGATWSGASARHISYLEGYNRNILKLNDFILKKKVSDGGWLGKERFSQEEQNWISKRIFAQKLEEFNLKLLRFYQEYNAEAIKIWHNLINVHEALFHNTEIKYGIKKLYCNNIPVQKKYREFSLLVHILAINILNYLEKSGVALKFNTKVDFIPTQDYQNIIVAVGAYDTELLKNTCLANRICAVGGCWLIGNTKNNNISNFQLRTNDLWQQNYSYIGNNKYIIGSGYAFVGFDVNSLCKKQENSLMKRSINLAEQFCKDVEPISKVCFRAFTDNDVPVLHIEDNHSSKKTIIIGGMNTGTTTSAPLTGQIVANILQNTDNPWMDKINEFNHEWEKSINGIY